MFMGEQNPLPGHIQLQKVLGHPGNFLFATHLRTGRKRPLSLGKWLMPLYLALTGSQYPGKSLLPSLCGKILLL
jgi:hypothetical protein